MSSFGTLLCAARGPAVLGNVGNHRPRCASSTRDGDGAGQGKREEAEAVWG